ncbi:unnamed protein product, partial [Discosporangium mesarthrocarpum]
EGRLAFAKSLLEVGEFQRASQAFGSRSAASLPHRARFLRWYSLYLAGEKRREAMKETDPLGRARAANPNLPTLLAEVGGLYRRGCLDAFGLYMYAVVVNLTYLPWPSDDSLTYFALPPPPLSPGKKRYGVVLKSARAGRGSKSTATRGSGAVKKRCRAGVASVASVLVESIRAYPFNWSAWLDLASLNNSEADKATEELEKDPPSEWMFQFYLQHLYLEQQHSLEALSVLEGLAVLFPNSSYLLSQTAVAQYHLPSECLS